MVGVYEVGGKGVVEVEGWLGRGVVGVLECGWVGVVGSRGGWIGDGEGPGGGWVGA